MPLSWFILARFICNMYTYNLCEKAKLLEAAVFYVICIFSACDFLYFFIFFLIFSYFLATKPLLTLILLSYYCEMENRWKAIVAMSIIWKLKQQVCSFNYFVKGNTVFPLISTAALCIHIEISPPPPCPPISLISAAPLNTVLIRMVTTF